MDAISICNAALLKLGVAPITSFDAGTAESFTASKLYPIVKRAALSSHTWSFATQMVRLGLLGGDEYAQNDSEGEFHYALPGDFLRALHFSSDARSHTVDYQIRDTEIISTQSGLRLKYIADMSEDYFPPHFLQALIARVAAEFCLPITDSTSRMEVLYRLSELEFQKARGVDNLQEDAPYLADNSLLEVRG